MIVEVFMKKTFILLMGIILLASCTTVKPYDSDAVKMSMHIILDSAKSIGAAVESGDVSNSDMDFKTLKEEFHKLAKMEPPKGSEEEWEMIHKQMVSLSIEGLKAAKDGDVNNVGRILGELFALQKKGHGAFKE
jgi:hypothetical protein